MVRQVGPVVVADGDERSRRAIGRALQRAGYETVEVGTGAEAIAAVQEQDAALLMLEIVLPDMTGYEVCSELREEDGYKLPIFFLSGTRTEPIDRIAGLLLGADDFIVKPFDVNEVVVRVHRFVSRRSSAGAGNGRDSSLPNLTAREQEILALIAEGARQAEIARRLSISQKTVATHIQNLLGKVGVHSRAELVARAYQLGLVAAATPFIGAQL